MHLLLLLACAGQTTKGSGAHSESGADTSGPADTGDSSASTADPVALAAQVSETELASSIEDLAGFGTRHLEADNHDEVRAWLRSRLEDLDLDVEESPFEARGIEAGDVIGRLDGADPDTVWIFQAHFDSTSELAPEVAPGADDNASGCAAVLEAARILSAVPLRDSVWFVFTDAEEQGSLGSAHLADELAASAVDVRGVVAPDMMAWWPLGDGDAFDILGDADSETLVTEMAAMADTLGVANKTWVNHAYCYGDDHTSWQEDGFPAISPMDCVEAHNLARTDETLPHYHQSTDLPDTLYLPFTAKVTGVIVASLASWAGVGASSP